MSEVALAGRLADRERLVDAAGLVTHDDAPLAGGEDGRGGPFTGVTADRDAGQWAKTKLGGPVA